MAKLSTHRYNSLAAMGTPGYILRWQPPCSYYTSDSDQTIARKNLHNLLWRLGLEVRMYNPEAK